MKTTARAILAALAIAVIGTVAIVEGNAHGWSTIGVVAAIMAVAFVGIYMLAHLIYVAIEGELPPSLLAGAIRKLRRKP